jgi:hypothetical protein
MLANISIHVGRSFHDVGAYPIHATILDEREAKFYNSLPEHISRHVIVKPHFFLGPEAEEEEALTYEVPSFLFPLSNKSIIVDLRSHTSAEKEEKKYLYESQGVTYFNEEISVAELEGDYQSIIESIPNIRIIHSPHDLRVIFDIYRSFDIEINGMMPAGKVKIFTNTHPDGRVIMKGVAVKRWPDGERKEKTFHICVEPCGTVHCRTGKRMLKHGRIVPVIP